jgi:hypothetical protein
MPSNRKFSAVDAKPHFPRNFIGSLPITSHTQRHPNLPEHPLNVPYSVARLMKTPLVMEVKQVRREQVNKTTKTEAKRERERQTTTNAGSNFLCMIVMHRWIYKMDHFLVGVSCDAQRRATFTVPRKRTARTVPIGKHFTSDNASQRSLKCL